MYFFISWSGSASSYQCVIRFRNMACDQRVMINSFFLNNFREWGSQLCHYYVRWYDSTNVRYVYLSDSQVSSVKPPVGAIPAIKGLYEQQHKQTVKRARCQFCHVKFGHRIMEAVDFLNEVNTMATDALAQRVSRFSAPVFTVGHRRQVTAVTRLPRWRRRKTRFQGRPLLTML